MIAPGFYQGLSNSDYHSDPDSYSKTNLANLAVSPKHMQYMKTHPQDKPAWLLGRATHAMILEGDRFINDYATMPDGLSKRTKAGKAWMHKHWDKEILTREMEDQVYSMARAVCQHPEARGMLLPGESETSVFFKAWFELRHIRGSEVPHFAWTRDPWVIESIDENYMHSVTLKVRPDNLLQDSAIVVDLKTCRDVSSEAILRDLYKYKYHWSSFLTRWALKEHFHQEFDYVFIYVEKEPPHDIALHTLTSLWDEIAEVELMIVLENLAQCNYYNQWPGQDRWVRPLDPPAWLYHRHVKNKLSGPPDF